MKRIVLLMPAVLAVLLAFNVGMVVADEEFPENIIYTEPVVGVLFSHAYHVNEAGMDCESCHDAVFQMEAFAAQREPDFNMLALSEGRYCGACHDGEMAFDANSRCASCHIGVIGANRSKGIEVGQGGH
jgi:c(7)-type cytochrome triheme protein